MQPSSPSQTSPYCFECPFTVRDYELDLFGVVNNAHYLHYLEHTRHAFLKSLGFDVAAMQQEGYNLVVAHLEIDYKQPLKSGDQFLVQLAVSAVTRVRFVFLQDIYIPPSQLIATAKVVGTAILPTGRPGIPSAFREALLEHVSPPQAT